MIIPDYVILTTRILFLLGYSTVIGGGITLVLIAVTGNWNKAFHKNQQLEQDDLFYDAISSAIKAAGGSTEDHLIEQKKPKKPKSKKKKSKKKHLGERCGLSKVHPHLLRKTYATTLYKQGVPLNTIAKLLGHANLETIARYVVITKSDVKKVLNHVI